MKTDFSSLARIMNRRFLLKGVGAAIVAMARDLQMKVGKPNTINELNGGYFGSYRSYGGNAMGGAGAQNSVGSGEPNAEVVQGTFAPGQIIDASVSVVFDLE